MTDALRDEIAREGFAFVPGARMGGLLGPLPDWDAFAASWERLGLDTHMADQGRYRRRRHAVYALGPDGAPAREPHQPHYQALDYNPLNGGVDRWFEPVEPALGEGPTLNRVLRFCAELFGPLAPAPAGFRAEVHQFRIEAGPGMAGQPTPEGPHRDGVDYVLVLMVRRQNVREGTTTVYAPDRQPLGSFTLAQPLDAALLIDPRVYHGVTAVEPLDPARPAFRDVLVVTLRRR